MLEKSYDWYVKWIRLDPSALSDLELLGLVGHWKSQMEAKKAADNLTTPQTQPRKNAGEMSIRELFADLKAAQLWGVITALVAAVAAIAAFAYKLGSLNLPAGS